MNDGTVCNLFTIAFPILVQINAGHQYKAISFRSYHNPDVLIFMAIALKNIFRCFIKFTFIVIDFTIFENLFNLCNCYFAAAHAASGMACKNDVCFSSV